MKKFIVILVLALVNFTLFAQTKTVTYDGKTYEVGSEEYKQACIEYYNAKVQSSTSVMGYFANEDSFNGYQRGIELIADGVTMSLIGAGVTGIGYGIYKGTEEPAAMIASGILGGGLALAGGIMQIAGIYKMKRFSFNGGCVTFSF